MRKTIAELLDALEAEWCRYADQAHVAARGHAINALDGDVKERILAKERLAEAQTLERAITDLQKVRAVTRSNDA